jgi:hypothetical protein|tara:strand:- start:895 stop:1275 length:381 start_codon:yes stop_codon:yes gene_type:complete
MLPVLKWSQNDKKWTLEEGVYVDVRFPGKKSENQDNGSDQLSGNTIICKNCGNPFEPWAIRKSFPPDFCGYDCMKLWLDFQIEYDGDPKKKPASKATSVDISATNLPILRWDVANKKWWLDDKHLN